MQGLANLVGYALTKASRSYPHPYAFSKFVKDRGGDFAVPGATASEQQFTFNIASAHLKGALQRSVSLQTSRSAN